MLYQNGQSAQNCIRVILLSADGTQLLLVGNRKSFAFPTVNVPRFQRVAPNLASAVKRDWGQEIICFFSMQHATCSEITSGPGYYVAQTEHCQDASQGSKWVPTPLIAGDFSDSNDDAILCDFLARCCSESTNPSGPFERPGWFPELKAWINKSIAPCGLRLTGAFLQLNASAKFSLIRFDTNGPAVWFKAVGEPNVHEFPISRTLACLFPAFVPRILAVREEWNAWLTIEVPGKHPDEKTDIEVWAALTRTLADLQIASIGNALHLIEAGCRDVRTSALVSRVDPFLDMIANLMERQTTQTPTPLTRSEIAALSMRLKDVLFAYSDLDILNTLGHLDFNAGNIIASGDYCVLLDWAEACVGPPLLTFQYLLERLRGLRPAHESWETRLLSEYSAKWQSFVEPDEMAEALSAAPLLAVFAYAAAAETWRNTDLLRDPGIARHFRSLARRMNREADRWSARGTRSVLCTV